MPAYFRFGIGPFRFSYRLTRTQAQKRAAARQRAARRQARQGKRFDPREHITVTETATPWRRPGRGRCVLAVRRRTHRRQRALIPAPDPASIAPRTTVASVKAGAIMRGQPCGSGAGEPPPRRNDQAVPTVVPPAEQSLAEIGIARELA